MIEKPAKGHTRGRQGARDVELQVMHHLVMQYALHVREGGIKGAP